MRLDNFIIGILIFAFITAAGILVFGNVIDNYDLNATTDDFTDVYNPINELYNTSQDIKTSVLENDITSGASAWESMATGSYNAIRLISQTFSMFGDILDAIVNKIGIPPMVIVFAVTGLLVAILFAIIYLIFRVK
jgi:hypothetical protein